MFIPVLPDKKNNSFCSQNYEKWLLCNSTNFALVIIYRFYPKQMKDYC